MVYAASIEQMKAVCTALPDCEGFNSEGWVKSRVGNKKRAVMDLYMKQTAVVTIDPELEEVRSLREGGRGEGGREGGGKEGGGGEGGGGGGGGGGGEGGREDVRSEHVLLWLSVANRLWVHSDLLPS